MYSDILGTRGGGVVDRIQGVRVAPLASSPQLVLFCPGRFHPKKKSYLLLDSLSLPYSPECSRGGFLQAHRMVAFP